MLALMLRSRHCACNSAPRSLNELLVAALFALLHGQVNHSTLSAVVECGSEKRQGIPNNAASHQCSTHPRFAEPHALHIDAAPLEFTGDEPDLTVRSVGFE